MKHKMNEFEMNSKPRRAQGGKGLLSRSISVQNPQESMPLIPREEREEEEREIGRGGRRQEDVVAWCWFLAGARERGEG